MCGSFSTQHLSWRDIVTLSRLSTNATLPEFPDADRFPMRKKSEGRNEVEYFADYPRAKRRARSGRCSMGPGAFLVVEAAQ